MKKYKATITVYIEAENPKIASVVVDEYFGDILDQLEPVALDIKEVSKIPDNRNTYKEEV